MSIQVREIMATGVHTISPDLPLAEFEERTIECGVAGFPVVAADKLVGIVSRSDVVRTLAVERTYEGQFEDAFGSNAAEPESAAKLVAEAGARIGARLSKLSVKDAMRSPVETVEPDHSIEEAAKRMRDRRVHRLPVVEDGRVVGIVSALDIAKLVAEGRLGAR